MVDWISQVVDFILWTIIDGCSELCRKYHPQCGEHWPAISQIKSVFIGEPKGEAEWSHWLAGR